MKTLRTLLAFLSIGLILYAVSIAAVDIPRRYVIPFTVGWAIFVLGVWMFWRPVWNTVSVVSGELWGYISRRTYRRGKEGDGEPS